MKVACTVWGGGKVGDNFKDLPIVKSAYSERFIPLRGGTHLISITGDLSTELYQKKDGSTGESIKCLISSFYYIPVGDGKKKEQQNQNGQQANHSRTMALISISKTAHRNTNPIMRRSTRTAMEINRTTHRKATGSIRTTEAISSLSSMLRRRIKGCLTITASIISAMRIFRFDMPNNKKDLSDRLKSVG